MKELDGDGTGLDYQIEDPASILADLSELGIEEVDKGVCEDTFENRRIIRRTNLVWEYVYSSTGAPTGLLKVRSAESTKERRLQSLTEKRPILSNPTDHNSDYLTGLDLIAEDQSDYLAPPWVLGATRKYLKEQEAGGPATDKRKPVPLPHRCTVIKFDGIRCQLWGSGRLDDSRMCRIHLRTIKSKTSDDVQKARDKLMQAAPYAVDKLEELLIYAESEVVQLKAATEILDRSGVRSGLDVTVEATLDVRPAMDIIAERLQRLADGAAAAKSMAELDVIDAEVVEEDPPKEASKKTKNGK